MLGIFALLFMALWQDYRDGGKSPPPVVAGVGVTTVAYLIGVLFLLDKEVRKEQLRCVVATCLLLVDLPPPPHMHHTHAAMILMMTKMIDASAML
jgi:hypothetical protein